MNGTIIALTCLAVLGMFMYIANERQKNRDEKSKDGKKLEK